MKKKTVKDLKPRKDADVKGGLTSAVSDTLKTIGNALNTAARG